MGKGVTKRGAAPSKPPSEQSTSIEGEVENRLEPVLSNLSRVQREQILSTVISVVQTEAFSGPLPHPRHLEEYDRVLPGGADRIFRMTEKALESNIARQDSRQKSDQNYRLLGMWLGFAALMSLVAGAVFAGMNDKQILSGILMGATAIGSIGVFITAHHKK
ncbi:DUF2335 domain-containing protein [Agrobacterium sp. CMT1]|uniref:DUF2335 domain-containing protein n=1 Tax=Agrobacterium sp. CMT1 TaxID=3128901 RepID=UPI0030785978